MNESEFRLPIIRLAERSRLPGGATEIGIVTPAGTIPGVLHPAAGGSAGVVWVSGAQGGFNGPGGGLYAVLGRELAARGVASIRIHYRWPNDLDACVLDTLAAVTVLRDRGAGAIAIAGHSFGGAVAILAGTLDPATRAVFALSSQQYGTWRVADLSPRPLYLLHGAADERLPATGAEEIYERAGPPKEIAIVPGGSHSLVESAGPVGQQLRAWLAEVFDLAPWSVTAGEPERIAAGPGRAIELAVGDVLDQPVDAAILGVNDRLMPDRATLRRLYGIDPRPIERELYRHRGSHEVGSAVLLDVPELPIPRLIGAVLGAAGQPLAPADETAVRSATARALAIAAEGGVRSLALPAFGGTGPRLPYEATARAVFGAIADHWRRADQPASIRIALPAAGLRPIFAEAWRAATEPGD